MKKQLDFIEKFMKQNIMNFLVNRLHYKNKWKILKIYNYLHSKDYKSLIEKIRNFKMNINKKFFKFNKKMEN